MKTQKRRNALKLLAVGAPVVWAKPIVSSVILPVHAETSPNCGPATLSVGIEPPIPDEGGFTTFTYRVTNQSESTFTVTNQVFSAPLGVTGQFNGDLRRTYAPGDTETLTATGNLASCEDGSVDLRFRLEFEGFGECENLFFFFPCNPAP